MNKKIKTIIAVGGTGGHVIPAKNIASLLIDAHYVVTWIGTKHGIEHKIVARARCYVKN